MINPESIVLFLKTHTAFSLLVKKTKLIVMMIPQVLFT